MNYKLLSITFPAGYRFLSVNAIAILCSTQVSDFFSKSFFMVSLLATFSGFAVASQSYVISRSLSLSKRFLLTFGLLACISFPFYFLWRDGFISYMVVLIAALGYSIFEVARSDMAAKGEFKPIVCQGLLVIPSFLLAAYALKEFPLLLVLCVFWLLPLAATLCYPSQSKAKSDKLNSYVFRDVSSYSISSGMSTGLTFFLPLILAKDFGVGASTELAQVMAISSIFLLFPKYLSVSLLVDLQVRQNWGMAKKVEKKITLYVLFVSVLYFALPLLFFPGFLKYTILLVATLLTQVALPFANTHMVLGRGDRMLKVNAISAAVFFLVFTILLLLLDPGEMRAYATMSTYLAYVIFRNRMTKESCAKIIKN